MLMVISPAKDLDMERKAPVTDYTQADLLPQSEQLIEVCRELTPLDIAKLMKLSDKLAGLNAARFSDWQLPFTPDNASAALYAFNGDVYQGLDAASLSADELHYAQQHLRILSGLYGVLRPLDLMQAYRLEMGTRLETAAGKNLYEFWQERITDHLNQQLDVLNTDLLLNLASQEYFKAVKPAKLNGTVINVQFKDWKNDRYKIISFYAKKARGLMARYVIEHQVSSVSQLKAFDRAGYCINEEASSDTELLFQREQVA
ncbi:peroxide stress protein YaaA [Alkalimonas collagenimarina]|uniref:UPF0246 protein Q3O60_13845 n=1 Tax=Alkalimonas collagenimarina TaxID=400390 RepID=A0ABT9H1T8_9GAMM|nr:peroxide stress protein YaaA [Alkalimonas collagenimarina]MDP4537270.1 peroxide stress protein YaaA [Alkalimonas collagenimarina]